jgi:integrase
LVEPVVRNVELANGEEVEEEIVIEHDLIEAEAEQVARERGHAAAERYADIALGRATPLGKLFDDYLAARDDLSISSVRELKTERRRLADFLGKDLDEVMIEEITSKQSHPFLRQYLPNLKTPRAPNGLAPETIDRAKVLLSGLWEWARDQGHVPLDHQNPWKGLPKAFAQKKRKGPQRRIFTPEEWRKLLDAVKHGDPLRDVMVLAMHTGARLENLLEIEQVDADGSGFRVLSGKTDAAVRWVPVVHPEAVEVLLRRRRQFPEGSIFGDATISKATGERSTPMSKRFGKLRRKVLPEVPDGELVLHCARHTWRTAALRAEVSDSATRQLGGWIDEGRDTSSPYNHGLTRDQLREAMEQIVGWMVSEGYIKAAR